MKTLIQLVALMLLSLHLTGCASFAKKWKALISGDSEPTVAQTQAQKPSTYSEQTDLTPPVYRKYRRTTKREFEDQAQVDSRAGSLWVMEGQGSYLFAQNVVRMIGDPIAINLEGEPRTQLAKKAEVISDLLKRLEERRARASIRGPASEQKKTDEADATKKADTPATPDPVAAKADEKNDNLSVNSVPTRIVERLVDGNYRIRGAQPFMIGNREYKVIVSGIVKAEDFNENGLSATELLDPSFDVVSSKSTELN